MDKKSMLHTFLDVMAEHLQTKPDLKLYTFLDDAGKIQEVCQVRQLHHQAMAIAGFLDTHLRRGERAMLMYTPGLPFIHAFFGCLYAGVVAVPVFPPLTADMYQRLLDIKADADPGVILTDSVVAAVIDSQQQTFGALTRPLLVNTQTLENKFTKGEWPQEIAPRDLAMLQYTSGSTGSPKGVMVTHHNLVSNEAVIQRFTGQNEDSVMIGWLPHFHDMGLIGTILFPAYVGYAAVLMSPQRFMQEPLSWLRAISDFGGTITTAPNFAYERCVRAADQLGNDRLDLSRWDIAINGAEPVRARTLSRFYETFKHHGFRKSSFCPAYGLAESTLFVAGITKTHAPTSLSVDGARLRSDNIVCMDVQGKALVSHGQTDPGQRMAIVDSKTRRLCKDGQVGEIWLKGPSVAAGYWNKPEVSRETFGAYLPDGSGPFLRTGDLGFVHDNALYMTGRLKNLIIIQGRNYYPQDIEELVQEVSSDIRPGRVAAFALPGRETETVGVVAEYRGRKKDVHRLYGLVNEIVGQRLGIKIAHLVLIPPKALLVTTSGKIRHKETRDAYMQGRLEIVADISSPQNASACRRRYTGMDHTIHQLIEIVAQRLQLDPQQIDIDLPLGQYGLASIDASELAHKLELLLGRPFAPTQIYEYPTIRSLAALINGAPQLPDKRRTLHRFAKQTLPVAIIGMACSFPGAPDLDAFWHLLEQGRHAVSCVPEQRPGPDRNALASLHPACRWGAFIEGVTDFDAPFFNISADEAKMMDPQHRKYLEIVWATIENAGYAPSSLASSQIGVFAGVSSQDYSQLMDLQVHVTGGYTATGVSHAMLANRISYLLDLHGPSEAIDIACASSLVAVHRAVQSICNGECQAAIAGGVNLLFSPMGYAALSKAGLLSPSGRCRAFDADADGYVRGEGVGAVYLKPLGQALADGDYIYAVIKGSAVTHGGKAASLTAPNENLQARVIVQALQNAAVPPESIGYIEAHGTGTALGDPIEFKGLCKAFETSGKSENAHLKRPFCAIGSVKSNIGHLEAAAGIAGLIKCALMLKHRTIAATLHCDRPNPLMKMDGTPFYIAGKIQPWHPRNRGGDESILLRAGVSSFGFGGTYAHVVLEAAQEVNPASKGRPAPYLIVFSAKTRQGLMAYIQRVYDFVEHSGWKINNRRFGLEDLQDTLYLGREAYGERMALIPSSKSEFKRLLKKAMNDDIDTSGRLYASPCRGFRGRLLPLMQWAETWLQGMEANLPPLDHFGYGRRIPIPGYPFERRYYWFSSLSSSPEKVVSVSNADTPASHVTQAEVLAWLVNQAAQRLGLPKAQIGAQIDPCETFESMQFDSIALIDLHDRCQRQFGRTLPLSIIQECATPMAWAQCIAQPEAMDKPDFEREVAFEKEKIGVLFEKGVHYEPPPASDHGKETILLTGATGYLGAFLLRSLLTDTDAYIYCLVRAATPQEGLQRLEHNMAVLQISDKALVHRVSIVCGDLGQERMGLASTEYDTLAGTIDTVFHCGAVVDWMKPYLSLKSINVGGTSAILHFCTHCKVKWLHYISSLAVLPLEEGRNVWREADQPTSEALTNGYAQSKWVADRLCGDARQMGLPVNLFRFDFVAGSPSTGVMKETDFIVRLIKGCIQLGYMPAEAVNFDILAVDHLSRAVVKLAQCKKAKTYHLVNRQPFATDDFADLIRNFRYALERMGFERWKTLVQAAPDCTLYPLFPFLNKYTADDLAHYYRTRIDNTNTLTDLYQVAPEMITQVPTAKEVLSQAMRYLMDSGFLPAPKKEQVLTRQSEYWQKQLQGAPPALALPVRPRDKNASSSLQKESFELDQILTDGVLALARIEEVDPSVVLLAVFQILLFRYSRQTDIPVAVPLAAAARGGVVHTIKVPIIRTFMPPNASFTTVLHHVVQTLGEAYAHLDLPSEEINQLLYGDQRRNSLLCYDTQFVYRTENGRDSAIAVSVPAINLFPLSLSDLQYMVSGFTLSMAHSAGRLKGSLVYPSHRFTQETVARVVRHFQILLANIIHSPQVDICAVPIMAPEEVATVVQHWNATQKTYPRTHVHDLFTRQAAKCPDAVALRSDSAIVTYGELDQKSDQLAGFLAVQKVTPGELIGICTDKSFELMIGLLAILKSGCAYFPIDPAYPEARKRFMIEDAQTRIILTQSVTRAAIPKTDARIVCLDTEWEAVMRQGAGISSARRRFENLELAYVIYTSGSTGRPKGVRALHAGLVNMLHATAEHLPIGPQDCFLTCASLSFDASVLELFYPLIHGASIALLPTKLAVDGQGLKTFLEKHPITFMMAAVPTWRLLEYAGWQGSPTIRLANAGEALPYDLAQTLLGWSKAAYNVYGPTETTVICTLKQLQPHSPVTIGRVMANSQIYIVDSFFNPMPIDACGEVYIGGAGLAQGYHNRAQLTQERFISNPMAGETCPRLYRTGDLACFRSNGEIAYHGRIDTQIKLRGQRIELGEIEHLLAQDKQVKLCAVIAREDPGQEKRLVAYIIPAVDKRKVNISSIKQLLKSMLPWYMVPADYVLMDQFPSTPSGKIDRNAFPIPGKAKLIDAYTPPETALQQQLCDLWQALLDVDKVGIHNNFLDLGGDSIRAMQLLLQLNTTFNADLTIQTLYENLTIASLAQAIAAARGEIEGGNGSTTMDYAEDISLKLDVDLRTTAPSYDTAKGFKKLLITGATGFLGAYLLHTLLSHTSAKVYCLVRAQDEAEGMQRIIRHMANHQLWQTLYQDRIVPVAGDLGAPQLALAADIYDHLAEQVDAVYHCGSNVNFAFPYRYLKKANVLGTREMIQFAVRKKWKHLFYISTIGVFEHDKLFSNIDVAENDPLPDPEGLFSGYSQSKWASEQVVAAARRQGVPISVFRPGSVLGHSITGISNPDDLVNVMIRLFPALGAVPEADFEMNGLPVDFMAETIVKLSMDPRALGRTFHIVNPATVSVKSLIDYFISFGNDLPRLPHDRWLTLLEAQSQTQPWMLPYVPVVKAVVTRMQHGVFPRFLYENTEKLIDGYRQTAPIIDEGLFHRYLRYIGSN